MRWSSVASGLAGMLLLGSVSMARADDTHKVFAGCIAERTETSIVLKTSGDERITIDTTWLKATQRDTLTSECVTVSTIVIDGKYIAESVEEGVDGQRDQSDQNRDKGKDKDKDDDDDKNDD